MADGYSHTSFFSRSCVCSFVAQRYVPAEAAVGLVLKTKSAALRDGDRILGVVKATDTRHDGRSQGLVAPNVKAQIAMQLALLEKASLLPSQIEYVLIPEYFNIFLIHYVADQFHRVSWNWCVDICGERFKLMSVSGTSLGDLIEIQGINEVFEASHSPERPLIVGAVKSCLGHAELVAGLVGVLKTVGSFTYGSMPGLAHLTADNMNPSLDCKVVPLHIPHEPVALKSQDETVPVRALILYALVFCFVFLNFDF